VIKASNNIYFTSLLEKVTPKGTTGRIALPVAGDSPDARAKVMRLVDDLGFDPVDAGTIDESRRQQPGTPCYTQDLDATRLKEALAAAHRSRVPEYRKAADDAARTFFESQKRR
jgi:predicted dinucleotide-binding enzyme